VPTRNIVLTDRQTALIDRLVTSGRYQNASEVLREGLRMIERRDVEDRARLAALRAAVKIGIDDIAAGRFRSFDSREALRRYFDSLTESAPEGSARDRT